MAKKNTFLEIIGDILDGVSVVSANSYTSSEKDTIKETRRILLRHGKKEAVEALDKVIRDMDLGITRSTGV